MNLLEQFFVVSLCIQIVHACEELLTGFHKKWYVTHMPFWIFLLFEIAFEGFWIFVWLLPDFPNRGFLQSFFLILMFANGVQHIVWAGNVKKYVPGLFTAFFHVFIFLLFYFQVYN
jgi:hypothetical protein